MTEFNPAWLDPLPLDALRDLDQRLTHAFEQCEAIDADPSLPESQLDVDKPIPFAFYEDLVESGFSGQRPTWREAQGYLFRELRAMHAAIRAELEGGKHDV